MPGEVIDSRFDLNQGFRDFHNAVYFPVRAMLTGVDPYSEEYKDFHPDGLGFPTYAQSSLLVYAPFGFLTLQFAEIAYLVFNFAVLLLLSWLAIKQCDNWLPLGAMFLLAAVIILCRPGLLNFFGMQMSMLMALGCLLALKYAEDRPALSGFGLLLACCKPHFGIPLAALMLFRRNLDAVVIGIVMVIALNAVSIWIIASQNDGVGAFVDQMQQRIERELNDPIEIPDVETSWTRIDVASVVSRWQPGEQSNTLATLVPIAILAFGCLCILMERNKNQRFGINSRTGLLALLVMLVSVYHQPYDTLVLWIPLIALIIGVSSFQTGFGRMTRWMLVLLLLIPMFNYLGTRFVLEGGLQQWLPGFNDYTGLSNGPGAMHDSLSGDEQIWDGWQWKLAVTVNGIALTLASAIVGLNSVFGRNAD